MKKPHMRTIIGSSKGDCVLIILFPLYGSIARPFECNLFRMCQWYDPSTCILEEKLIQY